MTQTSLKPAFNAATPMWLAASTSPLDSCLLLVRPKKAEYYAPHTIICNPQQRSNRQCHSRAHRAQGVGCIAQRNKDTVLPVKQ